jgi:hypothetical protein
VIEKKNFSNFAPGTIPADTEYVSCNFTQHVPDTTGANPVGVDMFPGYSGPTMTFRNCNLVNCKVPAGSIIENCNTAINEYGLDDFEETIVVDSVEVHRRQFKKNRLHGRYNPQTEEYEYHPSPIEVPE